MMTLWFCRSAMKVGRVGGPTIDWADGCLFSQGEGWRWIWNFFCFSFFDVILCFFHFVFASCNVFGPTCIKVQRALTRLFVSSWEGTMGVAPRFTLCYSEMGEKTVILSWLTNSCVGSELSEQRWARRGPRKDPSLSVIMFSRVNGLLVFFFCFFFVKLLFFCFCFLVHLKFAQLRPPPPPPPAFGVLLW